MRIIGGNKGRKRINPPKQLKLRPTTDRSKEALFNILNNTTFTDIYSCYMLFRRNLVPTDKLKRMGWSQHAEILSIAKRQASNIYEVPISYHGRTFEEGKKIRPYHVISVFWTIFVHRFLR